MSTEFPWDLSLHTGRLDLVLDDQHVRALTELAAGDIHDPAVQPFTNAWTDRPPKHRSFSVFHWWYECAMESTPQDWTAPFIVLHEGRVIGAQGLSGRDFPTLRVVRTGSWLALPYQRQGFGTEMRAAVLQFAFDTLGAHCATSDALTGNLASQHVSQKLGYAYNGHDFVAVRGKRVTQLRYLLDGSMWRAMTTTDASFRIQGPDGYPAWFGTAPTLAPPQPAR